VTLLAPIEPSPGVNPPEGSFADAYPLEDERQGLENASLKGAPSLDR
jgi:hypothetical protein